MAAQVVPITEAQRLVLDGTQQTVAFVRAIAYESSPYYNAHDDEHRCPYCRELGGSNMAAIDHRVHCLYVEARLIAERLRLEGVPW